MIIEPIIQKVKRKPAKWACGVILSLMMVALISAISKKTLTNDEVIILPAGYYHLVDGNFQFNNEHPPLIKMLAAVPMLFLKLNRPTPPVTPADIQAEAVWNFHARFWQANKEHFSKIAYWSRVAVVPVTVAVGVLIFIFGQMLFNPKVGLIAVCMFALDPTFLAHGRIAYNDVAAAGAYLGFFVATGFYVKWPTKYSAALVGLALGLALLIKFSLIVLGPVCALLFVAALIVPSTLDLRRGQILAHAGLAFLVMLLIINAGYFFQSPPLSNADIIRLQTKTPQFADAFISMFSVVSAIVPTYFLVGLFHVLVHNQNGHSASLLGMSDVNGWWYYFPVAFALKTTIPELIACVAGVGWAVYQSIVKRDLRFIVLLSCAAVFAAGCMSSRLNIGVRHFLPVYPFLFIMAAALISHVSSIRGRLHRPAIALLAVGFLWGLADVVKTSPHFMSYLNQFARGPNWAYLSDSNIEYGDDVQELAEYLKAKGQTRVRAALLGGWATLPMYDIQFVNAVVAPATETVRTEYIALGASFLNGSSVHAVDKSLPLDLFAAYRTRQPEAVFGKSIFLYRMPD